MLSMVPLVVANWKMYKDDNEAVTSAKDLANIRFDFNNIEIVVAPSFTSLFSINEIFNKTCIHVAAQNVFCEKIGPYTGEISIRMIKNIGCNYVILGHSERRSIFNESNELICKKVTTTLSDGIIPILCVGENSIDKIKGRTFAVIEEQIVNCLKNVIFEKKDSIVLAYEPVWAIGTGEVPTKEYIHEIHSFIKSILIRMYSENNINKIRIIYGGSVTPKNVEDIISIKNVDGVLVGGASLNISVFEKLIKLAIKVRY